MPERWKARQTVVVGYILRWFSSNQTRCRAILYIKTDALIVTPNHLSKSFFANYIPSRAKVSLMGTKF